MTTAGPHDPIFLKVFLTLLAEYHQESRQAITQLSCGVFPHTNPKRQRGGHPPKGRVGRWAARNLRHPSLTLRVSVALPRRCRGAERGACFIRSTVGANSENDGYEAGRASRRRNVTNEWPKMAQSGSLLGVFRAISLDRKAIRNAVLPGWPS